MSNRNQKLVDIMFAFVLLRHDPMFRETFDALSQQEMADWVAKQLLECGFPTSPCGMSWGVLDDRG